MERQAQAAGFRALGRRVVLRRSVLQSLVITLIAWFVGPTPSASQEPEGDNRQPRSVAEDFLRLPVGLIATGHHGVGPYHPAANPGLPIRNTVDSVGQAYGLGARVVEVEVHLTPDERAVFQDDFLSDFTCIHASTTLDLPGSAKASSLPDAPLKLERESSSKLPGGILWPPWIR